MKKTVIYKITSPTGKIYIGQSRNIEYRFRQYRNKHCSNQVMLYNSIQHHGVDAHSFDIVHDLPTDVDKITLDQYECLYIQQYRDCGFEMLNIKNGGSNGPMPESVKEKIGKSNKGRGAGLKKPPTKESTRIKISQKLMGHTLSEETRKKISRSLTGKIHSEETKKKRALSNVGKRHSEATKAMLSILKKLKRDNKTWDGI